MLPQTAFAQLLKTLRERSVELCRLADMNLEFRPDGTVSLPPEKVAAFDRAVAKVLSRAEPGETAFAAVARSLELAAALRDPANAEELRTEIARTIIYGEPDQ